jgi:dynein heavy chain 1
LNWFGDWSDQAFYQVAKEFTDQLDLDDAKYEAPMGFPVVYPHIETPPSYRDALLNAFVYVHQSLYGANAKLVKRQGKQNYATPRHYLDFIQHYVKLFHEKRSEIEEEQRHLNIGVEKLKATVETVEEMRKSLAVKKAELEAKNAEANEKLKKASRDHVF